MKRDRKTDTWPLQVRLWPRSYLFWNYQEALSCKQCWNSFWDEAPDSAPGKHQLKCAVKKMYFFSLLITLFSLVPFGFIRLFMSHSLWILHHLMPTNLPVAAFFRFGCLSVLHVSFYSFYCIALIDLTPLKLIIFVQYFLLILQCPLISKLLLELCNFIFRIYPFFWCFCCNFNAHNAYTSMYHCVVLSVHTYDRSIFYSADRSDRK